MNGMLNDMFSYVFIQRAVLVGVPVSLCAALLGVSLVLKRYSMIGDGLSHVAFGSLAIAMSLHWAPLAVSMPVVTLCAFLLLRLKESGKIKGDAAIAILSSSALAIGVIATSLSSGMNTDVYGYLFGSILAMGADDVVLSLGLSVVVLGLYLMLYNRIFAVTFDETFAKATGIKAEFYNMMIAILTAVTIVLGMRMMGAMLISSLIIFPALSSMRIFRSFRGVMISSAVLSVSCFLAGLIVSYAFSTPVGASIVVVNLVVFLCFALAGRFR
ncbi:MAG: metal ABC transporter permease [Anaerofustis sp.]